ncbi:serine threonine-protein kinase [Nannochloropsis gaditana]|uniref:Serine threonine-protein kinase n=1 Tax=Nannochloropsis gaditana TaxID=72520 RepID=W7TMH7_9STRA|nr:serine threonine-protein kinase [Nannochloropsis gaditana]
MKTASPKLGPGMNRGKSRLRDHGVGSPASIFSAGSETCQERTEDGPCDERAARKLLEDWQWAGRLSAMMPSVRQCAPVMAARRTLFQMARFQGLMVENWVATAEQAQDAGRFRLAESALRHAACWGLGGETLLVEEAKLLHAQGKVHEALLLLEPNDVDLPTLRRRVTDAVRHGTHLQGEDVKRQAATRLLLATDWMVQAGVKHGQQVLDRYKLALELRPKSEAAFFAMAKYTDFLLEARKKELEAGSREGAGGEEGRESGESGAGRGREREEKLLLGTEDELLHSYYRQALENYAVSLQHGLDNIFQSLPRFLTLAFEVGDMADLAAPRAGGAGASGTSTRNRSTAPSHARVTAMDKLLQHCSLVFRRATQHVVSCAWYTALPQLLSQVGSHGAAVGAGGAVGSEVQGLILEAIVKVLEMHPEQAMWSTTGLIFSRDSFRRRAGERILRSAHTRILDAGAEEAARMLLDGKKLFAELLALANDNSEPPPDKRLKIHIGKRLHLLSFLVPVQAALTMQIRMFGDTAYVLHSKAKPKKITVYTTCEKQLTFLCKQERSGDLRKDARMMEFNGIVNRLLQRDAEGRRRKLRLRTYAVVCLNEECGLMEWVTDTACLRGCIVESARGVERQSKYLRFSDLRRIVEGMQASHKDDPTAMAREFRSQVLPFFPPTLHRWFFKRFAEPTAWLEARTIFTRSAAVWSAIGHVVGLGDRHGENILIDTARGECVHVDFDCLFDKGLTLARPELVPFRLTPNMVDAMGVVGYEGPFRRVMEVTLTVLREHRLTLLSVLEPFLADPTVGWDHMRSGPHLSVIDERLRGIYNLRVPARRSSSSTTARSKSKQQQQQQQQHRQQSDVALPLSIPGQVQKLIQEATALENLARMYIGWQSWM